MSESGKLNVCQALTILRQGSRAVGFGEAREVVEAEALKGTDVCNDDAITFTNKVSPCRYQLKPPSEVLDDPVRASQWIRENAESRPRLRKAKLSEILADPEFSGNEGALFSVIRSVIKNHTKINRGLRCDEDFIQDCCVRILKVLDHFDPAKNSFRGFIYMITPQVQAAILEERNRHSGLLVPFDEQLYAKPSGQADLIVTRIELTDNPLSDEGVSIRRMLSSIASDEKWFTFLLLHLRLEFIRYQQRAEPTCDPAFSCRAAELLVPWFSSEEKRQFLNWRVSLAECWRRIVMRLGDEAPQSFDVSWTVSTILAHAMADTSHKLHWNTAKKRCEEQLIAAISNSEHRIDAADARHLLRWAESISRCMKRKDAP